MRNKSIKVIYEPPDKVTEEMERGLERAYSILFQAVMRNRQAKAIKSKINNENEYAKQTK